MSDKIINKNMSMGLKKKVSDAMSDVCVFDLYMLRY